MNAPNMGLIFSINECNLKDRIKQINKLDYSFMSMNCRKHIVKYYSAKGMALIYQNYYREILNK